MRIEKDTGLSHSFQIAKKQKELTDIYEKLANGKAVNRASDDASALAMAKELEKMVRGHQRSESNIVDGMSALRIADGGSAQIGALLQRQRELAVQSANGTLNDEQRSALDAEFQALTEEMDRISASTSFNNQQLLNGSGSLSDGSGSLQVGPGGGGEDRIGMESTDLRASTLGISGSSISSAASATQALGAIDQAMETVNGRRTANGALYNRLQAAEENAHQQGVNTASALSRIEDLDFAKGLTEKVRTEIMANSTTSALQHYHQISRTHLLALLQ